MISIDDVISYCDDMIELIKTPYETKGFENKVKSSYIQIKNWLTELKELKSSDNKSPEGNSSAYKTPDCSCCVHQLVCHFTPPKAYPTWIKEIALKNCKNFQHINTCDVDVSELEAAIEYYKTVARTSEQVKWFSAADKYWSIVGWLRELRNLKIAWKGIKR